MIHKITLPFGKTISVKFKPMDSIEIINYKLFGDNSLNRTIDPEEIIIGKCDKCGNEIKININDIKIK